MRSSLRAASSSRSPATRTVGVVALGLLVLLLASPGLPGLSSPRASTAGTAPHSIRGPALESIDRADAPHPAGPPPSAGTFYGTTVVGTDVPALCENATGNGTWSATCYPEAQNPNLLDLTNGELGVVFSTYTGDPGGSCPTRGPSTDSRLAFALSGDNGHSFGASSLIGNTSCGYSNQLSPAFTVLTNGTVVGVFLAESYLNATAPQTPSLATDYVNQTPDALEFVRSYDNGSTFTTWRQLPAGTKAVERPSIATFGSTVYVAYDNGANGSASLGAAYGKLPSRPIAVDLLYSANGGATWHGPYALPGNNPVENYTAMSPTVAVSSNGTVAVGYVTNRQCAGNTPPPCSLYSDYQDDVVVATSSTNGSSWTGPYTVQAGVGEAGCYDYDNGTAPYFYPDNCLQFLYQSEPQIALRWMGTNSLVTAYSGAPTNQTFFYQETSVLYSAVSNDSGASWATETVQAPGTQSTQDEYSTPTLGISGGQVFLGYEWKNLTNCFIFTLECPNFDTTYSAWVTESPDGAVWSPAILVQYSHGESYQPSWFDSWAGFADSMAFQTAGQPEFAFALDQMPVSAQAEIGSTVYSTISTGTSLLVATLSTAPTAQVVFVSHGLPSGTLWSVALDGNVFSTVTGAITVPNVPKDRGIYVVGPGPRSVDAWVAKVASLSVSGEVTFVANTTVDVNWSLDYGLTVAIAPLNNQYTICFCLDLDGNYYILFSSTTGSIEQPAMPWFFPAGTRLSFIHQINQGTPATVYWNGTGPGSYTGPGAWANVTMNGPINETLWNGDFGNSSVAVTPVGLPTGTAYSFDVNGRATGAIVPNATYEAGLPIGAYTISNASAPSTRAGWGYFGTPSPGPQIIVPYVAAVNLTFAAVDLASSPVDVSFHAANLSNGVRWTILFNGSTYASQTPWINLTTRVGVFPLRASTATAPDDSAGYAPPPASWVNITGAGTYPVLYSAAYAVRVEAGLGGTTSPMGLRWAAPGSAVPLSATPLTGYTFGGWTGSGSGAYVGGSENATAYANFSLVEVATFVPLPAARFNLTFLQFGLPAGAWWTVELGGAGYSSNSSVLEAHHLLSCSSVGGHYALSVPIVPDNGTAGIRYTVPPGNRTICQSGLTPPTPLVFTPQFEVRASATALGVASVSNASALGGSVWVQNGTSASLAASPIGSNVFLGWLGSGPGNYTGTSALRTFQPKGPVTEVAEFGPAPPGATRNLTFTPSPGFVPGTAWEIQVDGVTFLGTNGNLTVRGLPETPIGVVLTLAFSPDGRTRYEPTNASETVRTPGDQHVLLPYAVAFYGTIVGGPGGTVLPSSGWFAQSAIVRLRALPDDGQRFVLWSSNGTGYTGTDPNGSFTADRPFQELASFEPVASPSGSATTSGGTSMWASPILWAALALIGLTAGLVLGVVLRRRSGGSRPPLAWSGPHEAEPDPADPFEGST
jgi:hypothetical protein